MLFFAWDYLSCVKVCSPRNDLTSPGLKVQCSTVYTDMDESEGIKVWMCTIGYEINIQLF